jgi:hypothetical protein
VCGVFVSAIDPSADADSQRAFPSFNVQYLTGIGAFEHPWEHSILLDILSWSNSKLNQFSSTTLEHDRVDMHSRLDDANDRQSTHCVARIDRRNYEMINWATSCSTLCTTYMTAVCKLFMCEANF